MSTIRHLINVLFLAALCVTVGHTCGHVSPSLRFQLVGFTSTQHLGDTGVLGFTLACQAEFPGSRMCTSKEILETVSIPGTLGPDAAWARPSFEPSAETNATLDASGQYANPGSLTCSSWTRSDNTPTGLTVDSVGAFRQVYQTCNVGRPVACCALVP